MYRKIHVVLDEGQFKLLGSDCYQRIYGTATRQSPVYISGSGKTLSDEERRLLMENTAAFIDQLEVQLRQSEHHEFKSLSAAVPTPMADPRPLPPAHKTLGRGVVESRLMREQFGLRSSYDDDYSGSSALTWQWTADHRGLIQLAASWRNRTVTGSDHDLVLRQFDGVLGDIPYHYALKVEHLYCLPKFRTLRVLHELGFCGRRK